MVMSDNGSWVENAYYEYLQADNARLKAEVERLRKAGDVLEVALQADFNGWPYEPLVISKAIQRWNAAKEGKPSEQKSPSFIEDLGNGVEKHDLLFRYPAKKGKQV